MHFRSLNRANRFPFTPFYRASEAGSEFSLFEALRDSIYSEVATLISLNESRPHFLVRFLVVYLFSSRRTRREKIFPVSGYIKNQSFIPVELVSS